MSPENIILSQGLNEPATVAPFRDRAKVFMSRHKLVIFVELLIMALVFAAPLFTFSSGILGFPIVLLMLWLRKSNIQDLGLRRPSSWLKTAIRGVVAVIIILTVQALVIQPLLRHLFPQPPNFSAFIT